MSPREFLDVVVRPNIDEFLAHYDDLRRAYNAIMATDALAAHLYDWSRQNAPGEVTGINPRDGDSAYRVRLAEQNVDFKLLRDLAKAQKHVELHRHDPLIKRSDQMLSRSIAWGEARWGEGRFGGVPQVVVEGAPGGLRYVETVLRRSVAFLEAQLVRLGI